MDDLDSPSTTAEIVQRAAAHPDTIQTVRTREHPAESNVGRESALLV